MCFYLLVCKINNLKDRNEFNRPVIHITKTLLYHHRGPKGNPGNFITFEKATAAANRMQTRLLSSKKEY